MLRENKMALESITISREFGIKELKGRLRKVTLRGFPNIRIYEDAEITNQEYASSNIRKTIFTPQPNVYVKGFLDRIEHMEELFAEKGIDIFHLNGGIDYIALENGKETQWTLIPPVVEMVPMKFSGDGLKYDSLFGYELKKVMKKKGYKINPEIDSLKFEEYGAHHCSGELPLICDGSHRVELGLQKRKKQNLLLIEGIKLGFPYYAAPLPYSQVKLRDERPPEGMRGKVHILTEPGHKLLYRLFPTGGINNGTIRPE